MQFSMVGSLGIVLASLIAHPATACAQGPRFEMSIAPTLRRQPVTGRLIVAVSKNPQPEPGFAIGPHGPAIFGIDLDQLRPGDTVVIDDKAAGYPTPLSRLSPGSYWVQPIINVYERVSRSDGHTIWVPINDGRAEFFNRRAGNLYGDPQPLRLGPATTAHLTISRVIPEEVRRPDTDWVKRVRIQSQKLTAFWGRPMYIHATVLLPRGYDAHPTVRYPVIFTLGHGVPFFFSTDSSQGRRVNPVSGMETGYDFYHSWKAEDFPRVIAISLEQNTPYFLDSYSVNSANNGPYGDAVVQEIIPELEQRFRILGKPYARQLEGASTSGWQTLALQLRNPDFFGGAWILQPDPIDFRRYGLVDIYSDTNAFASVNGQFTVAERPFRRTVEGQVRLTNRQVSLFEDVLGSRGRSGYQLEAWEAVYGPIGADGYPKQLWDKRTGTIDRSVAEHMREHGYDLRAHLEKNWPVLGPKLAGKLHFFCGDMDDFYLNLAVYQTEDFLKTTTNPKSDAQFTYGRPMKGHSWHAWMWAEFVRLFAAHVKRNAPPGENTAAWNY